MTTSIGKTLRLGRLFDADSNTSMILPMDHGVETTPYMKFGDTVRMEARNLDDTPLFGAIDQKIVPASNKPRS